MKLLAYFAVLLLIVALSACGPTTKDTTRPGVDPIVYTDHINGCQYLAAVGSSSSLTPRMGADGKQICVEPRP